MVNQAHEAAWQLLILSDGLWKERCIVGRATRFQAGRGTPEAFRYWQSIA
jgi:hypothetical protein